MRKERTDMLTTSKNVEVSFEGQFINRLKTARKKAGISQAKLARLVDLPATKIQNIESGKARATIVDVEDLSFALNMAPKELLGVCSRSANERVQTEMREVEEKLHKSRSDCARAMDALETESAITGNLKDEIKECRANLRKEIEMKDTEIKDEMKKAKANFNKRIKKIKADLNCEISDLNCEIDACRDQIQTLIINWAIIEDVITLIEGDRIEGGLRLLKSLSFGPNDDERPST
jgi:transcriptional regulator with XRE-family HTH domain